MDDLQLNISTRQPAKTKKDSKKSHDYKFVKTNLAGKTIARKRPIHPRQSQQQNEEPQKKVQKLSTPSNQNNTKDLATSLLDLSENKGKFKGKNYQDITDDLQINRKPRPGGWISSLFKNNPDVPRVGQRAVKPIVEKVFTGCNLTDLDLHPHSVANLQQNLGLKEFMSVQQKSIPIILQGRDVLIRSQTGSGKTLAYALPIIEGLQAIRPKINRHDGIRVVVVLPTRELAVQTYELFVKLVKPFTWLVPGLLSGGQKRKAEKARLRKGLNILVGTPGRINDHLRHTQSINFALTRCLVLDEADCLLDMGYEKDVAAIVKALEDHKKAATYDPMALVKQSINKKISSDNEDEKPAKEIETDQQTDIKHNLTQVFLSKERQTILLSATLTKAVENLAGITMVDPVFVDTSEGRAVIADSLKLNVAKDVKLSKSSIAEESPKPAVANKERVETKTVNTGGETRGGLKQFSGLDHPDLFSNVNTQLSKQTTTAAADDSDSDSDYEYFKVQKEQEKQNEVVEIETDEVAPEINKFDLALKTALIEDELILPASVNQTFLVIPMKLRLVTLCSLIVEHCVLNKKGKIIVFMATLEMVDYHADLIETVLCGKSVNKQAKKSKTKVKKNSEDDGDDDEDDGSVASDMEVNMDEFSGAAGALVPVDLEIFSLHGSMQHERRIEVFKQFRKAKSGVLICSDVAARGIDVPRVDLVLQYCAPASATNYVHRVGRTGRATQVGAAIMFLLPSEVEYVRYLEQKRIRLKQASESNVLEGLRRVAPSAANAQRAAIQVQTKLEQVAHTNKDWLNRASRAYTSWVRFYSGYPRDVRPYLQSRSLHLGHAAKAFALRDTPANLARRAKNDTHNDNDKPNNRLTVRDDEQRKRPGFDRVKIGGGLHTKIVNKQTSMHTASEYDSGLPPITATKKQKKQK